MTATGQKLASVSGRASITAQTCVLHRYASVDYLAVDEKRYSTLVGLTARGCRLLDASQRYLALDELLQDRE